MSKVIKFSICVIASIAIFLVMCVGIDKLYLEKEYGDTIEKYSKVPDHIVVANTGTSHGADGFDYSDTEVKNKAFNFGMESQSIYYDRMLIEQNVDRFDSGSVLFIVIDYFTFWYEELSDPYYDSKNLRYYVMLDSSRLRFNEDKSVLEKHFPSLYAINTVIGPFVGEHPEATEIEKQIFAMESDTLEQKGIQRATYHMRYSYIDGVLQPMNQDNIDNLCALIELCQANEIIPIMVTTPYTSYYRDAFAAEVLETCYNQIDVISDKYNVEYWDYSQEEALNEYDLWFSDTDHLNKQGAQKFTNILIERINNSK